MSYKLIHVCVKRLGSVLFVVLRKEEIVLILFLRQQPNFDFVNIAVI